MLYHSELSEVELKVVFAFVLKISTFRINKSNKSSRILLFPYNAQKRPAFLKSYTCEICLKRK